MAILNDFGSVLYLEEWDQVIRFGIAWKFLSTFLGVCGLLRAKGFPWISPAGHILMLVPRFDREFVPTFQGHGSVGGKNGTRFEMNFVFNEGLCLNK